MMMEREGLRPALQSGLAPPDRRAKVAWLPVAGRGGTPAQLVNSGGGAAFPGPCAIRRRKSEHRAEAAPGIRAGPEAAVVPDQAEDELVLGFGFEIRELAARKAGKPFGCVEPADAEGLDGDIDAVVIGAPDDRVGAEHFGGVHDPWIGGGGGERLDRVAAGARIRDGDLAEGLGIEIRKAQLFDRGGGEDARRRETLALLKGGEGGAEAG